MNAAGLLWLHLQVPDGADLQFIDASSAWMSHTPLYAAIVLSLVISAMCGLLVVAMLVYAGLDVLNKINKDLQVMQSYT